MRGGRLRIALFIDWYLPGTKAGGPVRSVYSLVELLKNDFDFHIITSSWDLGAQRPYPGIVQGSLYEKDGLSYYYSPFRRIRTREVMHLLREINADVIYLNSFWSYSFSLNILRMRRQGRISPPVVLAPRGMLGSGALHLKSLKKRFFLAVARITGLHRKITFHATQDEEAADIKRIFGQADVRLAPNISSAAPRANKSVKKTNSLTCFFLSRISKVKNLHFALECLATVSPEYDITYDLFGNIEDEHYWGQCRQLISALPSHIHVTYRGELSFHEVQNTICGYNALFMPTLNENYGHSIVESLMSGCLAVISDQTPWTGINSIGSYALPLTRPDSFKNAIEEFARMDATEFRARSAAAVDYVSEKTDIGYAADQYRKLFNGAAAN